MTLNSLSPSNPTSSLCVRQISPSLSCLDEKKRVRRGEGGGKNFSIQLRCNSLDFACGSFNGSQMFPKSQQQQQSWKCERCRASKGGTATAGTVIRQPDSDKLHLLTSWLMNKLAPGFSLFLSLSFSFFLFPPLLLTPLSLLSLCVFVARTRRYLWGAVHYGSKRQNIL